MAARIDKDMLLKYADKVFLAVAVLFLAVVGLSLLGHGAPTGRYETVVGEYRSADEKQKVLLSDPKNVEKDVRTLLGLPDGDLSNSPKDDVDVYNLLVSTPPFAESFAREHSAQAPAWADRLQLDPYQPAISGSTSNLQAWLIPARRIAPTTLVLIQDKGYQPTGKEKDKQFGSDLIYISGQARLDLAQQTLWSREAAPGATTINTTLPTDYEVERRQMTPAGAWGPWQPRATVRIEQVKNQPVVTRVKEAEAKTLDSEVNKARRKSYADTVEKFRQAIQQREKDILHPPFYKMAGKEWLPPYEVRKVAEPGTTAAPEVEEMPAEISEMPAPRRGFGPRARLGNPGFQSAMTGEPTDLWFTDELAAGDVGKTYQYRVRIKFFNPIFNGPTAQTLPGERYLIEIPGAWSEPSDPITVASLVRFYFSGKFNTGTGESWRANVELHAWKHGWWYRKKGATFDLGDPIIAAERQDVYIPGGESGPVKLPFQDRIVFDAGATVVDLGEGTTRSGGSLRATDRLLFWDSLANRLESRLAWDDKNRAGQDQKKEEAETGSKAPVPVVAPPRSLPPQPGPRPMPSSATRPFAPLPPPVPPTPPGLRPGGGIR
jgi:hypothetical protein